MFIDGFKLVAKMMAEIFRNEQEDRGQEKADALRGAAAFLGL